jgi:outer membrane protein assembly factor BamE
MARSYCRMKYMIFLPTLRRLAALFALAGVLCLAAGCGSFDKASNSVAGVLEPYRMEIVQGNVVSREQVAAIPKGASRVQVAAVLGTPLLTSAFHADRWVYAFSLYQQGKAGQARQVTVYFKGDSMERIEADALPTESEFVNSLRTTVQLPPPKALEASEEALAKFPAPAPKAPASVLPPPRTNYPPLEP